MFDKIKIISNYMNFYKYKTDCIFSLTPLFLLLFITRNNIYLIIGLIISNYIYWTNKNIYTWILDTLFSTIFCIKYVYYNIIKNEVFMTILLFITGLIFFSISFYFGNENKDQLLYHSLFRLCFLILFLNYTLKYDNEFICI